MGMFRRSISVPCAVIFILVIAGIADFIGIHNKAVFAVCRNRKVNRLSPFVIPVIFGCGSIHAAENNIVPCI